MPTAEGFSFWNFLADVITIFFFVVLLWLLFIIFSDLFRRHDISGLGKERWVSRGLERILGSHAS